jgi:PqqD family protein of HPr-rel-A system
MPPTARYRAVDPERLRRATYDDEMVVFNPAAWTTHLLNAAATLVLEALIESPRSAEDIEALLREALDPAEAPDAHTHAARVLRELSSLGLVTDADR